MKKGYSKLLLFEWILPEKDVPLFPALLDINLMALLSGMERTEAQWRMLLDSAGFEIVKFWKTSPDTEGMIEAVLKGQNGKHLEATIEPVLTWEKQKYAKTMIATALARKNGNGTEGKIEAVLNGEDEQCREAMVEPDLKGENKKGIEGMVEAMLIEKPETEPGGMIEAMPREDEKDMEGMTEAVPKVKYENLIEL